MLKTLSALNSALRTLLSLVIVFLLSFGGWYGYNLFHAREQAERKLSEQTARVAELTGKLEVSEQKRERAETALRLSKVDHRVAQVVVIEQQQPEGDQPLKTTLRFVEVDNEGRPLAEPKQTTIDGDVIYIDAWVIKFQDNFVETGDPLRATSVCLFRRLFGEHQEPNEGLRLDPVGSRPAAYSPGTPISEFEQEIWDNFWDFANDPARAAAAGVRVVQGEAPSVQLRKGKLYKVQLRASDGLSIVTEDLPAALDQLQ
ncbi:MAG: hypothetical protein K1X74_02340 [Pirellulales bacterium]|nr:hypothetical protein [Pirellulales bacterium]